MSGLHAADEEEPSVWSLPKVLIPLETLLGIPEEADEKGQKLTCKQACLNGWVEQMSPCCAAASVAGAFNALQRIPSTNDELAVRPERVLPILQQLIDAELIEKRSACARALNLAGPKGIAPLGLLMRSVEVQQARKGRPLTGRKENSVSVSQLRQALREVVAAGGADAEARALAGASVSEKDEQVLWQRLKWPEERGEAKGGGMHHAHHPYANHHPHRHSTGSTAHRLSAFSHTQTTGLTAAPDAAAAPDAGVAELPPLRAEAALVKLCQAYMGWCKIMSAEAPSTSAVGNSHIITACTLLAAALEVRVRAAKLCGLREATSSGPELDITLTEEDPPELVEIQWRKLCNVFDEPDSVLLLHYWNHYALVYAVREWRHAATGAVHREFLTAKPAQRPCRWLPWAELRRWLLQWHGYTIFRLDIVREALPARSSSQHAPSPAAESTKGGATRGAAAREAVLPPTVTPALERPPPPLPGAPSAAPSGAPSEAATCAPSHSHAPAARRPAFKGQRDAGRSARSPRHTHGPVSLR